MDSRVIAGVLAALIANMVCAAEVEIVRPNHDGVLTAGQKTFLGTLQGKVRAKRSRVEGYIYGFSNEEIQTIIQTHLDRRSSVSPTAANMKYMTWDDDLAATAQGLACTCEFNHDSSADRIVGTSFSTAGQNLYMSSNWNVNNQPGNGVSAWFNEDQYFTYETLECASGEQCGHYTQGVWADSYKVGCGLAQCETVVGVGIAGYLFVCNYGPAGNYVGASPYESGASCSNCPSGYGGSCVSNQCTPDTECNGVTCSNGGTLDTATCVCTGCNEGFTGSLCQQTTEDWEGMCSDGDDGDDGDDGGDGGAGNVSVSVGLFVSTLLARWLY